MTITLTEKAAEKVKYHIQKRGKGLGIRVGVKTTGCSGLAYVLEYVDQTIESSNDQLFESRGIKIWVDNKSIVYLQDLEMDWIKKGINEGFDFKNPNEKDRCGCGESFNI